MSVYASFETGGQEMLASNTGWGDVGAWVDSLDPERYPEAVHLWEHGWSQELDALERQMLTALRRDPPKHPDVTGVVKTLLEVLGRRGEAEVLTVSGGLGADEEGDAE